MGANIVEEGDCLGGAFRQGNELASRWTEGNMRLVKVYLQLNIRLRPLRGGVESMCADEIPDSNQIPFWRSRMTKLRHVP